MTKAPSHARHWMEGRAKVWAIALSQAYTHLKYGSAYRQLRPTRLDKIKNLSDSVRAGAVTLPLSCNDRREKPAEVVQPIEQAKRPLPQWQGPLALSGAVSGRLFHR